MMEKIFNVFASIGGFFSMVSHLVIIVVGLKHAFLFVGVHPVGCFVGLIIVFSIFCAYASAVIEAYERYIKGVDKDE